MSSRQAYAPIDGRPAPASRHGSYGTAGGKEATYGEGYDAYGLHSSFRPAKQGRKKWLWVSAGILLLAAIAGGVVAAILVTRHNNSSASNTSNAQGSNNGGSTSSNGGSSSSPSPSPSSGGSTNSSDPSVFTKDPRLHQSFYGAAYSTPGGALYPNCNDTIAEIIPQVQLMSQITTRLRLYGMDCGQGQLVLEAIKQTKVNMSVFLGVYMDTDTSVYDRQMTELMSVLSTYGSSNILGIIVGNEYILDQTQAKGASAQTAAIALVLQNVQATKKQLAAAGYGSIPVGSGDAGSMVTADYASGLDFLMSNNHPFFAGTTITQSPGWAWGYLQSGDPSVAYQHLAKPKVWQGEIGWPSNAMSGGSLTLNGSDASIANLQYFLDNWVCQANQNLSASGSTDNPYIWFQAFDIAYNVIYGGAEPYWGLWDSSNTLKAVTIPNCPSSVSLLPLRNEIDAHHRP